VGSEPFGRVAATLLKLPKPFWEVPILRYASLSLDELRSHKGIGPFRINTIFGIVKEVYQNIQGTENSGYLEISVKVRAVREVEKWIHGILASGGLPSDEDVVRECLDPLLFQISNDGGTEAEQVARLRLGIGGTPSTLDELARHFGKTRERMRQRLELIARIMKVRWPEGQYLFDDLCERVADQDDREYLHALLTAAFEVFYPARRAARITLLRRLAQNPDVEMPKLGVGEGEESGSAKAKRDEDAALGGDSSEYVHDSLHELLGFRE